MTKEITLHETFLPIIEDNDYQNLCFYGGRDSTKSWGVAGALVILSHTRRDLLICCAKGTMVSINDSVKKLIEDMIEFYGLREYYYITDREVTHKVTKSTFIFKGLQHPDRLKSLEGVDIVWVEESNVDTDAYTFETFLPTIRKPGSKVIMTFNPKLKDDYVYDRYVTNPETCDYVRKLTYRDNPFLSDRSKTEIARLKKNNFPKYMHIYEGELATDDDEALFSFDDIIHVSEDLEAKILLTDGVFSKIVVALDPSGSAHKDSDACGIIVCGKYASQERFAVIEDVTGVMKPDAWAAKAVALYNKYDANQIIYESNYGGDMVESVIKSKSKYINPKAVRASKGKVLRAEPIQALYQQGRVDHFSGLGPLELEMTTYTGDPKQKSPNRLDAMVWGITYLFGKGGRKMGAGKVSLY